MRGILWVALAGGCKDVETDLTPIDLVDYEGLPDVSAGDDQAVDEGVTVALAGVAADSDGTIASTAWSQLTGPEALTLTVAGTDATFVAPATKDPATYTLRFEAEDDDGWRVFDDVSVVVNPVNADPLADAGDDGVVDERRDYVLDGDGSDSDGLIVGWTWVQTGGPPVSLGNAGAPATSFRAPDVDEDTPLTFTLTVADDESAVATDEVVVTVMDANDAPLVAAGQDQTVGEGTTVSLVGEALDPDGLIAGVVWTQSSGPTVLIDDSDALAASFVAPTVDADTAITLRLTATDSDGATAYDDVVIVVSPVNLPPEAAAGDDLSGLEQTTITVSGFAEDPDGTVASVEWTQLGGTPATIATPGQASTAVTLPDVLDSQVLTLRFTATDDEGATASDDVVITVIPQNQPPIVDAGAGQSVLVNATVTLTGSAVDADGTVVAFQWRQTAGPTVALSNANGAVASFRAPIATNDYRLTFELKAIDDAGAFATDTVDVDVRSRLLPPEANAGPDRSAPSNEVVVVEGSGTDADGVVVTYRWEQIGGPTVELFATDAPTTGFQAPPTACGDIVRLRLTVTDDDGLTDTDTVGFVITGVNRPVEDVGITLDFEETADGVVPEGAGWELGLPTTGPGRAYSGVRAWATNLRGNYANNTNASLCLPLFDLTTADDPTFAMAVWLSAPGNDALSLEVLDPETGWRTVSDAVPAPPTVDPRGNPAWQSLGYRTDYRVVAYSLRDLVGLEAQLRVRFVSDSSGNGLGAYVDTMGVYEEAFDTDGDGLPGVLEELLVWGSDPYDPDSDGDGFRDGDEVDAGSSPDNPAWTPVSTDWVPNRLETLDLGRGGLATTGTLWEYGAPTVGTTTGHTGSFAWCTNLDGDYFTDAREYLYLPPFDLAGVDEPTFAFRLWLLTSTDDTINVEIRRDGGTWDPVAAAFPAQTVRGPTGLFGWSDLRYRAQYELVALPLDGWSDRRVEARIAFRADGSGADVGACVDDLALSNEATDVDGDGLVGVIGEYQSVFTDPYLANTDGDGAPDGVEVAGATDPNDPAWYPASPTLTIGGFLDFEVGPQGLATLPRRKLWEHGVVRSGPSLGYSGTRAWATELDGDHFGDAFEPVYLPRLDLTGATHPILAFRLWARAGLDDGASVQIEDGSGWQDVDPEFPAYDERTAAGGPRWNSQRYRNDYVLAAVDLEPWAGRKVRARLVFRSGCCGTDSGVYVDDVGLYEEGSDPDGDGIVGVLAEYEGVGSDPLIADTDRDGQNDGVERTAGTDPLNPAWSPVTPVLAPNQRVDFEATRGGVATTGRLWEYGSVATYPTRAHSGSRVWGTDLDANYFSDAREFLYLPPLDARALTEPVLSFRLHLRTNNGDGVNVEVLRADGGWAPLVPDEPLFQLTAVDGLQGWSSQGYQNTYQLVLVPLVGQAGTVVKARIGFRTNGSGTDAGAFVDDVLLSDEGQDFDGDGLVGMMDELGTFGTDPTVADTDRDGVSDGSERTAGTDPLNPADYAGARTLGVGQTITFEADNGGCATTGTLWAWGTPTASPSRAHAGTKAWGTNLAGAYFNDAVEYLYLPKVVLTGTTNPTLQFYLWSAMNTGDGVSVEANTGGGWFPIAPTNPAYNTADPIGQAAWGNVGSTGTTYTLVSVRLQNFVANGNVKLRLAVRTTGSGTANGAYVDELGLIGP